MGSVPPGLRICLGKINLPRPAGQGRGDLMAYKPNKDGYYRATIVVGHLPDGREKRENIRSKSLTEFKDKLRSAQNMRDLGYDFDAKNMTVGEWADRWFEVYKRPRVSEGTATSYEIDIRLHIKPAIGGYKLSDIKPYVLQEFLNTYKGESMSHVSKIRLCLKEIFRRARIDGMIIKDVSEDLLMPETIAGERRPLTDTERSSVLRVAETHRAGLWVLTMLYAALRPEETVALMWSDIDLTDGNETITIRRAAYWSHGMPEIKKPKKKENKQGKEAERTIPIPLELSERLRAAKHRGLFVFPPAQSNGMMSRTYQVRMWSSFHRAVDIYMGATMYRNKIIKPIFDEDITPYYLRHSCCTYWFEMGLDLKTVQYLMGHVDIKTTANIYMHFMSRSLEKAGDVIRGKLDACQARATE